ncbi:MAG: nucleoside hydrolase [Pseudomonadota bacterium]
MKPIPVILDTDIGMDADDVWALALLLRCPELDLRLVVSACGDTDYVAACAAHVLTVANRLDVPVGVGLPLDTTARTHADWLGDFQLGDYGGPVVRDGVGALIDTIMASAEPVTVISIGPLPNLAAALQREPRIAERARFVGMQGSVRRGYLGAPKPHREYNVRLYPQAAQRVFAAPWDKTITPLDSCGNFVLAGEDWHALRASQDPLARIVAGAQDAFTASLGERLFDGLDPREQTTPLYDTVAVYLAFATEWLTMETLGIQVTDDGRTLIDADAPRVHCATGWRDERAFKALLLACLTGNS